MRLFLFIICWSFVCFANADFASPADFTKDTSELKALVFLSQFCPCSKSHIAHLNDLQGRFQNLKIFGVATDDTSDAQMRDLSRQYFLSSQLQFPVILDPQQELLKQYNALKTPHLTLLKKDSAGKYQVIYEGGVSDHRHFSEAKTKFFEENLVSLKEDQVVKYKNGRSLGCYIRRL